MFKKALALLLSLLMLLSAYGAVAEDLTRPYEDPAGVFTFTYSDQFIQVDRSNIDRRMSEAEKWGDVDQLQILQQLEQTIRSNNVILLLSYDLKTKIEITPFHVGRSLTNEYLLNLSEKLREKLPELYPTVVIKGEPTVANSNGISISPTGYQYQQEDGWLYCAESFVSIGNELLVVGLFSSNPIDEEIASVYTNLILSLQLV